MNSGTRASRIWYVGLCLLASWTAVRAAAPLDPERLERFLSGLAAAPSTPIPFVEKRMSAVFAEPLELHGELRIDAAGNIEKRILRPVHEVVRISADTLVVEQQGKIRTLRLANDRRWREFHAGVMGLLSRDAIALGSAFEVGLEQAGGDWALRLVPRAKTGRDGITALVASGRGDRLRVLRIEQARDEWQEMRFDAP
jgi:hypothetical protein